VYAVGPDDKVYPVLKIAAILEALAAEGVSIAAALQGGGLSEREIADPATRVTLTQVISCYRNAIRLSQDRRFAYRAGLHLHVSDFGMYGFAMLSSVDFRQTMRIAEQYHQLATPLADITFAETAGAGIWTISPISHPSIDAGLYRHVVELQFGIHTALHRDVMGPGFAPSELRVTFEPPYAPAAYAEDFGTPVRFGQAQNQFVFDATWLERRPDLGNPLSNSVVLEICEKLLDELKRGTGIVGKVRHLLLTNLMKPMSFQDVARHLGVSSRTLRRRLSEERTSYRGLVDELRRDIAIKYVRDTEMTVEDVAFALGFSDAASFRHAFRRWTSATPRDYRTVRAAPVYGPDQDRPFRTP
jgi:AraC-like DNA-binding protein